MNRELLESILDFNGIARLSADGGALGVRLALSELPDLVLMDIQMPEVDGYEALSRIRQGSGGAADIPVVAVTGNATSGDREKMLNHGFNDVITKPYMVEDVLSVIKRILG